MDLSRTRIVLRERGLLDVLDLSLRFVVAHAGAYARLAALVLPAFVLGAGALGRSFGWAAAWGFSLVCGGFAAAPFTMLASRLVFEGRVTALSSLDAALRGGLRVVALRTLTLTIASLGLSLFVFPGLVALAAAYFAVEVALLERATVHAALSRSAAIVRRETGEAVLALLGLGFLHLVAVLSAETGGRAIVAVLLASRAPESAFTEGWSWLALAGFWLFVPYAATARFLIYLDIRTRAEGWDIQTRFVSLAARETVAGERSAA